MECKFCKEYKEESEFYVSNKNKCKQCIKKAVNQRRIREIDKIREYDRNRPNAKERVAQNKERINRYKTENPDKHKKYNEQKRNWSKKNKHKRNAHLKVSRALYNGIIKRPDTCDECNQLKKIEAHHEDYKKPLEVMWLCIECHNKRHIEINNQARAAF